MKLLEKKILFTIGVSAWLPIQFKIYTAIIVFILVCHTFFPLTWLWYKISPKLWFMIEKENCIGSFIKHFSANFPNFKFLSVLILLLELIICNCPKTRSACIFAKHSLEWCTCKIQAQFFFKINRSWTFPATCSLTAFLCSDCLVAKR